MAARGEECEFRAGRECHQLDHVPLHHADDLVIFFLTIILGCLAQLLTRALQLFLFFLGGEIR